MFSQNRIENVRKIVVLRANAIGDFIVTLPALNALRRTYPQAEIVLLGKTWHKAFLVRGRCVVDRVIVVPPMRGITMDSEGEEDVQELKLFFTKMREEEFDIAFSFQGKGIASIPFLQKLGAKLTVGNSSPESDKPDRFIDYFYAQSEVMRYLELVQLVGATTDFIEPAISVLPADIEGIAPILEKISNSRYVVLSPVANDQRRMWPLDNYTFVINGLKRSGYEVVITGSTYDQGAVNEVVAACNDDVISACGISLGELAALFSGSALAIVPDTGPLHLAQAVGCPTVGIFWGPNVINWGPLNRRIHHPLIDWELHCPKCGVIPNDPHPFYPITHCAHDVSFVRNITPRMVLTAAKSLLEQTSARTNTQQQEMISDFENFTYEERQQA